MAIPSACAEAPAAVEKLWTSANVPEARGFAQRAVWISFLDDPQKNDELKCSTWNICGGLIAFWRCSTWNILSFNGEK
jgi:hypothetical protein